MIKQNLENKVTSQENERAENRVNQLREGFRNYLIDTSAKVVAYAPVMATMEAFNGLNEKQIIASRASAALIDAGAARIYGKVRDYVRNRFNARDGIKGYLADTLSMIGTYTPVYAAILKANGASDKQTAYSLLMGAGIAALTARPYGKYVLEPWRRYWKKKQK